MKAARKGEFYSAVPPGARGEGAKPDRGRQTGRGSPQVSYAVNRNYPSSLDVRMLVDTSISSAMGRD